MCVVKRKTALRRWNPPCCWEQALDVLHPGHFLQLQPRLLPVHSIAAPGPKWDSVLAFALFECNVAAALENPLGRSGHDIEERTLKTKLPFLEPGAACVLSWLGKKCLTLWTDTLHRLLLLLLLLQQNEENVNRFVRRVPSMLDWNLCCVSVSCSASGASGALSCVGLRWFSFS